LTGWINIQLKMDSKFLMTPRISIDYGEEYSQQKFIDINQIDDETYQVDLVLSSTPKAIYFYPTDEPNTFTITSFTLRSHSEVLHILNQFLTIIKDDYKKGKKPLRILKKSYKRYKKHRFVGMLDGLEDQYRKIHPYSVQRVTTLKTRYEKWMRENETHKHEVFKKNNFKHRPLISIIMPTYNTPVQYLKKAIDSVLDQSYPHWELCIADDASSNQKTISLLEYYNSEYKNIKVVFREENGHISASSNTALSIATGEYVAFLDHDDLLSKNALLEMVKVISGDQNIKFIYSDEDKIDVRGKRFEPHFKSGWNPDMFYSHNYLSHLSVIKRELVESVGGFRVGYEGSQDYDLYLRVLEGVAESEVVHISKVLYHWRAIPGSSALDATEKEYTTDAGLKALCDYFSKKDKGINVEKGKVPNTYKVNYPLPEKQPLVSILIPTRDNYDILSKCVQSILDHTSYKNYEIIIIDNETSDLKTLAYFESLKKHINISILEYHHPFNYSAINNFGVQHAKGELIALLNNDTELITHNWLSEMVQHALRPDIGAVGAMLYFDDDTIQHAGVVLGVGGVANHSHKFMKRGMSGYFARLLTVQNYSAVTAACLVVEKELYEKVNGLNERELAVAFNDVDFCLKLLEEGKRNLWTPYVELYHHESVSRGKENTKKKKSRFIREVNFMHDNWDSRLKNDRYYNANLSKIYTDFRLNSEIAKNKIYTEEELSNIEDYEAVKKKYKIRKQHKVLHNFSVLIAKKKRKKILKKFNRIPDNFVLEFNQKHYLDSNIDVHNDVEEGGFINAFEHFILCGYDEVTDGKRRIGSRYPLFTAEEYAEDNPDIVMEVEEGKFLSPFHHFMRHGYKEFMLGKRELVGVYPFEWTEYLISHVKLYFDEKAYLEVNDDVRIGIQDEQFSDAWEHFMLRGAEEVRKGERQLHPLIPKQSEAQYAQEHQDIFDDKKYITSNSPFEHLLRYGAQEIIQGERKVLTTGVYNYVEPTLNTKIKNEIENFKSLPLISIIMPVYNVDPKWLALAIDSLHNQWYTSWELCIADDASTNKETLDFLDTMNDPKIKIVNLEKNVNISGASNAALKLASGEYIALMDNDDELTPDALYEMVKTINETGAEFIYSDEDKLTLDGKYCDPHFKPDYSPDMFLSQNYISHFTVIKKTLIDTLEGWTVGLEGSQDYDLYLKVLELTNNIAHIPKVLYHWRKVPGSTAVEFNAKSYAQVAGKKALENALKRRDIDAEVLDAKYPGTYRVKYEIKGSVFRVQGSGKNKLPLVSIVIPFKDKPELLDVCINSVLDISTYQNYEIIGISNNSEEAETFEMMKKLTSKDSRVSFYEYNIPFNYSAINNHAVKKYAKGKHIILLNNDIEVISEEWIESMLEFSQRDDVGAVGAKLYYPDDTIQHAGVTMGVFTLTGHNFKHLPRGSTGYMGRESVVQNVSAVTAACLMIKKDIYLSVNGLNEKDLKIAFNDIDFCLRIREEGYINVFTPYCEMYHHESITRGYEDTPKKLARFHKEVAYMQHRHSDILEQGDPYYNLNLTLESEDFGFCS